MLVALRPIAVMAGIAVGGLTTTVLALLLWFPLAALGLEEAPSAALGLGLLAGLITAGYVAGRLALTAFRFHGAFTGLLGGFGFILVSILGGSPAGVGRMLLLAAIAVACGAAGGIVAGHQRRSSAPG